MSSADHGATWTKLGHICYHDPSILSVDCTALPSDGGVALYFPDMALFGAPANVQRVIYRATTKDGVNFDKPQVVVASAQGMADPTVVRTAEGKVRLYTPTDDGHMGLVSYISDDGLNFTREGVRMNGGGMPGALLLADHRVRLFLGGELGPNQKGIYSMISDDGLTFTMESGMRFTAASPQQTDMPMDPSPIHLLEGGYLMAFAINPSETDPTKAQYRLATSDDGLTWTVKPTVFAEGGTSCLVETSSGTLFFYYGGD